MRRRGATFTFAGAGTQLFSFSVTPGSLVAAFAVIEGATTSGQLSVNIGSFSSAPADATAFNAKGNNLFNTAVLLRTGAAYTELQVWHHVESMEPVITVLVTAGAACSGGVLLEVRPPFAADFRRK